MTNPLVANEILANPSLANRFFGSGVGHGGAPQGAGPNPENSDPEVMGPEVMGPEGRRVGPLEFSGCRLKPRRRGFHTTTREPKRGHLRVPVFTNTTKIQRETHTVRDKKSENGGGRWKKESEILGGPAVL